MNDVLRCPRCNAGVGEASRQRQMEQRVLTVDAPIACGDCNVPMKVVRGCSYCSGKGHFQIGPIKYPCDVCGCTGEVLEAQP